MRPFNFHDLTDLFNYRNQMISLDCAADLTRSVSMLGASFIIDRLDPDRGACLVVEEDDYYQQKIIGQLTMDYDSTCAQLNMVMPKSLGATTAMGEVLKELCRQAGEWGALGVLAEVEVGESVFSNLQKLGFHVYDRLRIWSLSPGINYSHSRKQGWERYTDIDRIAVQHLEYSLIPPLSQAAQFRNYDTTKGHVYWQEDEVLGFLESVVGTQGVFLKPLLHPAVENVGDVLHAAIHQFAPLWGRPVYIAVPSYMGWLESTLYELDAQVVSLRTRMVRYLAQPLRVKEAETLLRPLERARIHPTHIENKV